MKRRYHFHLPGLLFLLALAVCIAAAMNSQNNLLFWVAGMMLAALMISGVVSARIVSKVDIRRIDPRHGVVGEPLVLGYAVSNRGSFTSLFNLTIEERPVSDSTGWSRLMRTTRAWVLHVGPRETVHGEAVFLPEQRGEARFDRIRVTTTFPFGIIKRSVTISRPQHTLIYPMIWELRGDVLNIIHPSGPIGMLMSQRSGSGDEYFGMREYRHGDSFRQVSWKRSAALDSLITIERTEPIPPRLRVVLDLTTATDQLRSSATNHKERRQLEEDAISLAASLIRLAEANGFEVGLSVLGLGVSSIPLRRSQWHVHRIFATLASLRLDAARDERERGAIPHAERASLVVIRPDRVELPAGREDTLCLTAEHLKTLALHPALNPPPSEHSGPSAGKRRNMPKRREVAA